MANSHNDRSYRYEHRRREGGVPQNAIVRWKGSGIGKLREERREMGMGRGCMSVCSGAASPSLPLTLAWVMLPLNLSLRGERTSSRQG